MTTEDLIIRLAGSAGPVQPLAPPARRFGYWTAAATTVTAVCVALIGSRPDSWTMVTQFLCPLDDPAHLLVGHFAPVAALALAGALIGRRAFEATGPGALWRAQGPA